MKRISVRAAAIIATTALLVSVQAIPAPAAVYSGACTLSKVKFKTSDSLRSTTSTSWVNVPDMSISFTVNTTTCLKIEFSAQVKTAANESLQVRALLDGVTDLYPAITTFAQNQTSWGSHAFNFGFTTVVAGSHTLKIQWGSGGGGSVSMTSRSLFVHYQ